MACQILTLISMTASNFHLIFHFQIPRFRSVFLSLIIDYTLWTVSVINLCNCLDMWNVPSISFHFVSFSHPRDDELIISSPKNGQSFELLGARKKKILCNLNIRNWLPINAIEFHRQNNLFFHHEKEWKKI